MYIVIKISIYTHLIDCHASEWNELNTDDEKAICMLHVL